MTQWGEMQAERYVRGFQLAFENLMAGRLIDQSAQDIRPGYRKALVGTHVVFFKRGPQKGVQEKDRVCVIVRILHQSMDPGRHM